jgi:exodeoxyribonuclease-5
MRPQTATVELSREQQAVFDAVLDGLGARQVQTVGGYAGTGKTVLVKALAEELPSFRVVAYTGKAAHVLRRKGVADASTVHAAIYRPIEPDLTWAKAELARLREAFANGRATRADVDDADRQLTQLQNSPCFRLKDNDELHGDDEVGGFLVDEASMVSRSLYDDLLSFGLPVVFVGDHGQLPPVGSDVFLMADPDHRLETIHRNAGPIARFAEHLRKGGRACFWGGDDRAVRVLPRAALTDELLLSADQIVTAFNKCHVALNRRVRELLGRTALLEPGYRVICLRNDRDRVMFNGMQGVVRSVRGRHMDFDDDDGFRRVAVPFDPDQFGKPTYAHALGGPHPFDYGWAVTCHKAQGSEWPHILVIAAYWQDAPWDWTRWNYTAASRAQTRLTWVV